MFWTAFGLTQVALKTKHFARQQQRFAVARSGNAAEWGFSRCEMGWNHPEPQSLWTGVYCTRPLGLKVRVRIWLSLPRAPKAWPLWLISIPPAFPVVITTLLAARTRRLLSASITPFQVSLPSAVSETQAGSLALTTTTN